VHEGTRLTCRQSATPDAAPVVLESVTSVAVAVNMICAGHQDGSVECAVDSAGSALLRFVTLTHLPPASFIAMPFLGQSSLCVVTREGGRLVCEGPALGRQAGIEAYPPPSPEDAGPPDPSRPVTQPMHRYRDVEGIVQVVGHGGLAARLSDGRVVRLSQAAVPAPMLDRVESMSEGAAFVCARRIGESGGEAWCWGAGTSGQLARRDPSAAPVRVSSLGVPVAPPAEGQPPVDLRPVGVPGVATSAANACARLSDGRVLCWGEERDGQLGRLPETLRLRPVVVLD